MQNTRGIPNPCGADGEIRTPDLPLTRRPLYQLSYTSGYVLLYAERTVFICPSRPEGRPGAMKGCSDTINPAPAEGSCPLCRHISPGSSPRRSSAREPIGLVVLSGSGLLRLPSGPSGGAQTHEPRGPKPRVLSTELHPEICFFMTAVPSHKWGERLCNLWASGPQMQYNIF